MRVVANEKVEFENILQIKCVVRGAEFLVFV